MLSLFSCYCSQAALNLKLCSQSSAAPWDSSESDGISERVVLIHQLSACFVTAVRTMTHITAQARLSVYKTVNSVCEELFFPKDTFHFSLQGSWE